MKTMMKTVISTLFLVLTSIWVMGCQTGANEGDKSSITQYYDANGLRVARKEQITRAGATEAAPERVTFYMYDQQGRVIAEANQDAGVIKEYLYLEGQPLAKVFSPNYTSTNSDGVEENQQLLAYFHNDHLGTPRLLTGRTISEEDAADDVEETISSPFGQRVQTNFFNGGLRFPGQYYDDKTGYHYNFHRDYDPSTGSYIQSDPIGLAGGINTYAYAMGNPVKYTDPQGLQTAVILNGTTVSNPFGHTAIATTGSGVYSYGNDTPLGSSLTEYLQREAPRRNTSVVIINTTPEQEAMINQHLSGLPAKLSPRIFGIIPDPTDSCATRTHDALSAGGLTDPYTIGSSFPTDVTAQAGLWRQALGGETVFIPKNSTAIPSSLNQFNPK